MPDDAWKPGDRIYPWEQDAGQAQVQAALLTGTSVWLHNVAFGDVYEAIDKACVGLAGDEAVAAATDAVVAFFGDEGRYASLLGTGLAHGKRLLGCKMDDPRVLAIVARCKVEHEARRARAAQGEPHGEM